MFRQKLSEAWEWVTFVSVMVMALAVISYEPLITAAAILVIAVGLLTVLLYGRHQAWLRLMISQLLMFILFSAVGGWLLRGVMSSALVVMVSHPASFLDDLFHGRWDKVFR